MTNLKRALGVNTIYPSPKFRNPINSKIVNTYIKGGDVISFLQPSQNRCTSIKKLQVTPDVPTVFHFKRRILDVGVGDNNLSVLVGGLACPSEIYALGNNCYGELGLESYESTVVWKKVNRCLFDCQVNNIISGRNATFYITQSYSVYGSGQWKSLVKSNVPVLIDDICKTWKTHEIAFSNNQLVLLGGDGRIFGMGDNSLGELGLGHIDCVPNPRPLVFFSNMNAGVLKDLKRELVHPVEKMCRDKKGCACESKGKCECDSNPRQKVVNKRYVPTNRVNRCYRC